MEDKTNKVSASDSNDCKRKCSWGARLALSNKSRHRLLTKIKSLVSNAFDLKFILLLAALAFDLYTVAPFFLFTIGIYGLWSVLGLIVTQSPIIYFVAEEIWREYHMLPMSEAFEISPERWAKSVKEYVKLVKKKRAKKEKAREAKP